MRFAITLIALALLPVMMLLHGWLFTRDQVPELRAAALDALRRHGVRGAVADLRFLDLRIAGDAPDMAAMERARAAIAALGPVRLVADEVTAPASLRVRLEGRTLSVEGWLPKQSDFQELTEVLTELRPDLELETEGLIVDPRVRWPEGFEGPLTAETQLLLPVVDNLRVTPWLEIRRDSDGLHLQGLLPANGLRSALLAALDQARAEDLLESPHTRPASFAEPATLLPFVAEFFQYASPRRLLINEEDGPLIEAPATRTSESRWLALLRPVTGGAKVRLELTLYPSPFHFPNRRLETALPAAQMTEIQQALVGKTYVFPGGSSTLPAEEQERLTALAPLLVQAGPGLRLVIGGHPDPEGRPAAEKKLALERAGRVHAFLVEQGLRADDVRIVDFEAVPPGTPGVPAQIHSVEILPR